LEIKKDTARGGLLVDESGDVYGKQMHSAIWTTTDERFAVAIYGKLPGVPRHHWMIGLGDLGGNEEIAFLKANGLWDAHFPTRRKALAALALTLGHGE
jgi:hypothetical protein